MNTLNDIRQTFLSYFKQHGHTIVPSSPLVLPDDPTLLFVNAGMNQFKNFFTGIEKPPYNTAVSSQKCIRAGGKHNDLDNVGYTARHHTFFEMLGNFSFGDYFKEQAISYAWNLLTKEFKIHPDKLLVTVYYNDEEAVRLWKKITSISDHKIIRIASADNFWTMGDTGPCGPCSEIFYDHGESVFGGPPGSADQDGDRYTEIWNLVFMQYNQVTGNEQVALPHPSIDTGAGLERLTSVLQGVSNNYDIDLFKNLIANSQNLTTDDPKFLSSHRVIADHLRSSSFIMADGILPSNEGRGYVLRRIMRRAMRHAYLLGTQEPLMYKLVPGLIHEMGTTYPELGRAQHLIVENLRLEEERFRQTLGRGLKLLDEEINHLPQGAHFSGDAAFKLYDTYGFPLDLTQDILREKNIIIDLDGFEIAMQTQKTMARASWQGNASKNKEHIWHEVAAHHPETKFIGYDQDQAETTISALMLNDQPVDQLNADDQGWLIVDQTPFYSEAGGQVGDIGRGLSIDQMAHFKIDNTQKKVGKLSAHHITVTQGPLSVGQKIRLIVDDERRDKVRANHSATHLMHALLHRTLGAHVTQKGSLVNDEKLRFDFSHAQALTPDQVYQIERGVNAMIRNNLPVITEVLALEEARKKGAVALFGEKYGETVRVVSMMPAVSEPTILFDHSIEFCGGTHVKRTGDIGFFKITSESGLAAGIRRIEAITGFQAEQYVEGLERQRQHLAQALKCHPNQLNTKFNILIEDYKNNLSQIKMLKNKIAGNSAQQYSIKQIKDIQFISHIFNEVEVKDLRALMDKTKTQYDNAVIVFGSNVAGKASLIVSVSPNLLSQYNAVDLVKLGTQEIGGTGGGGRPEMAQAGGPDGSQLMQAILMIESFINQ